MKLLATLNPAWIGRLRQDSGEGITFDCPACGPRHRVAAYFKNPRDGNPPAPWPDSAWERDGEDFAALTLHPSIRYPCWHGWIESGRAFDVMESPLVVFGEQPSGNLGPIALSPRQARLQAEIVLRTVAELMK